MRRRVGLLASIVPALAFCWSAAVHAQDVASVAPAKAGPEVIPQIEIPARADVDERFAQDVILRARGRDRTEKLGPQLDALDTSVREQAQLLARDDLKLVPITRLESLERHWRFFRKQLERWRRDLEQATAPYSEDAADLARRRSIWEATRTEAEAGSMASAFVNRIQTVQAQLSLAEQAVSGPLDRQIRLSRRANTVQASIEAGQKAVGAAIAYNDSRLARVDAPPIWELWGAKGRSDSALYAVRAGLAIETSFLAEYAAANRETQRAHNAAAFALLLLLIWLRVRSRKVLSDDPEIQASAQVLQRPISSWLVLVLVGALVFEPDAPMIMHQVALLLALVPVLRLLPRQVFTVLGPWPYATTALYLLARLSFLVLSNPFQYRLYLLFVTLLTLALTVWLLLRSRRRAPAAGPRTADKVVRVAGWFAVVVLVVSAFANVVGNVSLAEMLTNGLLDSGYVGLVLYAGVTVLASVLRLLLARRSISHLRIVTQHAGPLMKSFTRLLRLAALVAWVAIALSNFRVFRPIYETVSAVLTYPLAFGKISLTLANVLLFLFSVYLAFWVAKTVRVILKDEVLPKMSLPRGVGNSISSLSYYGLVMVGLFVALAAAGFEVSQLAIVIGALGVGIGFGLQNVVNNFVSGLILMFERPIQPGDVVEITGTSGKVREIGMRATTLTTFEGADVVVPNGVLLNEKLINWTLSDTDRRVDVNVGVAYGSDPRRVIELLLEVTKSTPGVASQPEPAVIFTGFGASSLDFGIRAWTNVFGEWVSTRTELTVRVYEALRSAGIEVPFPQHDVHLRTVAADARVDVQGTPQRSSS